MSKLSATEAPGKIVINRITAMSSPASFHPASPENQRVWMADFADRARPRPVTEAGMRWFGRRRRSAEGSLDRAADGSDAHTWRTSPVRGVGSRPTSNRRRP